MRITLHLPDGSTEVREIASVTLHVDGSDLVVTPVPKAPRISLLVPFKGNALCQFITHHQCGNKMEVELRRYKA
jgi:hypothetical protein